MTRTLGLGRLAALACLIAIPLLGSDAHAQCGALCIYEVATPDMGLSAAGAGARAQDAATAYFNPAGMTEVEEAELLAGLYAADFRMEFDQSGDTVAPFGGGNGGDAGGFLPGLGTYLVVPVADQPFGEDFPYAKDLRFGLAVNGIFGGAADYGKSWVGRTFITEVELLVLNVQPGLAWRVNDWLSVGASLNVLRGDLERYRLRDLRVAVLLATAVGVVPREGAGGKLA